MNGVHCAFQAFLVTDADLRFTTQGTAVLNFTAVVRDDRRAEEGASEFLRCTVWEDDAERLAEVLKKGQEIYAEGRVKLDTWTTPAGEQRAGLSVNVWRLTPLGTIGRRAPRRPRGELEHEPAGGGGRS